MATLHTPLPEMRHPTPPHSPRPWPKRLVLPPSPPTSEPGVLSPIRPALKPLLISLDSFSAAPILIPSFPYRYPSFPFNTETYGHQMSTAPALPIRAILIGKLIAGHALRREQVNRCVTSGVGVDGRESGYGSAGRNLETAARKAEAEMELSPSDSLMDVMVFENPPMKDAIQRSAHLSVSIRAQQCFSDGNHRTALFTFVLSLASYSILLSPRFSLYRAYLIISARDHPDNAENTLFDLGITETSAKLLHYSRSRVKPGTADWAYLEYWAEEVRRVVVHASVVEGVYTRIQTGSRWAGGEKYFFGRKQQLVEWKGLDHQMRLEVRLAHTSFKAGS